MVVFKLKTVGCSVTWWWWWWWWWWQKDMKDDASYVISVFQFPTQPKMLPWESSDAYPKKLPSRMLQLLIQTMHAKNRISYEYYVLQGDWLAWSVLQKCKLAPILVTGGTNTRTPRHSQLHAAPFLTRIPAGHTSITLFCCYLYTWAEGCNKYAVLISDVIRTFLF